MTSLNQIIVAVNVIVVVSLPRVGEFLRAFDQQMRQKHTSPRLVQSGKDPHSSFTLLQYALGTELDNDDDSNDDNATGKSTTFHCHLKYQYSSTSCSRDFGEQLKQTRPHPIFVDGATDQWHSFEESKPFEEPPIAHIWIVAPTSTTSDNNHSLPSNPKPTTPRKTPLFCLNANLYVHPQYRQELVELLEYARSESIQEHLCIEYQYGESLTIRNTFHVHQAYSGDKNGKEGFDLHATTSHYQRWKEFSKFKERFTSATTGHTFCPSREWKASTESDNGSIDG